MKARTRSLVTSLALLAAAGGALLLAWWGVDRRGADEAARKEKEQRVYGFEPGDVQELQLTAKGTTVRLSRSAKGWRIEPPGEEADAGAVGLLVERIARLARKSEVAAAPDAAALAGYGLAAPRAGAELLRKDGRRETLALGDASPFDGSLYVRATSGAVLLVAGDLAYWLDRAPEELRDRTVLAFDRERVTGLRIEEEGKPVLAVARRPGAAGGWDLTAPRPGPARGERVAEALSALAALRALKFADDAGGRAAELGFTRPSRAFVLLGGEQVLGRVELGREAHDSVYARSSGGPRIVEVDRAALSALGTKVEDWLEPPRPAEAAAATAPPSDAVPDTGRPAPKPVPDTGNPEGKKKG